MPFLISFIMLFIFISNLLYRRANRQNTEKREAFWEKEHRANLTRKKDISQLDFIEIPVDELPFPETGNDEIRAVQERLLSLVQKKIVNFTGISNTDLKLTYGAANITFLMEYDNNYIELVRTLYRYGKLLYDNHYVKEAAQILEYGIAVHTDVSANYTLLAQIYKEENAKERIEFVISAAESLESLTKKALLAELDTIYRG